MGTKILFRCFGAQRETKWLRSRRKKTEYEKEAIFAGKKSRKLLEDKG